MQSWPGEAMAGAKTAHPAPNASTSSSMSVVIASKIFIEECIKLLHCVVHIFRHPIGADVAGTFYLINFLILRAGGFSIPSEPIRDFSRYNRCQCPHCFFSAHFVSPFTLHFLTSQNQRAFICEPPKTADISI